MEPDVVVVRILHSQSVILPVVAADQHREAIPRCEAKRCGNRRGLLVLFPALPADIALLGELRADLVEIPFVFSQSQRFKNAVDIGQFDFCKLDLLRQFFLRRFGLSIGLIVFLGILLRRQRRVQRDFELAEIFIVEILQPNRFLRPF